MAQTNIDVRRNRDETLEARYDVYWHTTTPGDSVEIEGSVAFEDVTQLTGVTISSSAEPGATVLVEFRYPGGDWTLLTDENVRAVPVCDITPFTIDLRLTNTGTVRGRMLAVSYVTFEGTYAPRQTDETFVTINPGETVVMDQPFIFKVIRLDGVEILALDTGSLGLELQYSQNNGRTWTRWIPLNNENLRALDVYTSKFFEYRLRVTNTGRDRVSIEGVDFTGEFINITENFQRSNRMGVRADCAGPSGPCEDCGGQQPHELLMQQFALPVRPLEGDAAEVPCSDCDGKAWNPYVELQDWITKEMEFQTAYVTAVAGLEVDYFYTNPDENGIDHFLNEQQLHQWECYAKIKVVLPNGQIPDGSALSFDILNLFTFDSFTVHVPRTEFKNAFGPQAYPRTNDAMRICILNQLFEVQHSYAFRSTLGASPYYVLRLVKFQDRQTRKASTPEIDQTLDDILGPSGMDQVYAEKESQERRDVANLDQHKQLSRDAIARDLSKIRIVDHQMQNGPNLLSDYYYDFSSVAAGEVGVRYGVVDGRLTGGQHRSFTSWFRIPSRVDAKTRYNLWTSVNDGGGWQIDMERGMLQVGVGGDCYELPLVVTADIWYALLVELNQTDGMLSSWVYRRPDEATAFRGDGTDFVLHESHYVELGKKYSWSEGGEMSIVGSGKPWHQTNIRLFNSTLPTTDHVRLLQQKTVFDARHLILADNAERKFDLTQYRPENW